jgi:hypothetical protein
VDLIARRFRGVLIAIVVLGLSAGAVFAGHVVLQAPATVPTAAEQGDQNEEVDENDNEAPEADEADDQEAPDGTGDKPDNHGALVSAAARMETPFFAGAGATQFANHGAFVSCVAQMKSLPEGFKGTQEAFLATVTPTTCAAAAEARAAEKAAAKADRKAAKHGKGHKQR